MNHDEPRTVTVAQVEAAWYPLGLALVEEGFIPPCFIDPGMRERLGRVARLTLEAGEGARNA